MNVTKAARRMLEVSRLGSIVGTGSGPIGALSLGPATRGPVHRVQLRAARIARQGQVRG